MEEEQKFVLIVNVKVRVAFSLPTAIITEAATIGQLRSQNKLELSETSR